MLLPTNTVGALCCKPEPTDTAAASCYAPASSPSPRRRSRGSRSLRPIDAAVRRLDDLYNSGELADLTQRSYKVLRHYLTAADLREPGQVYQTPSATLEKLTGYGDRSISAANTDLVRAGLIERIVTMEGRRDPVWRTVFTPRCMALFFPDHSQKSATPLEEGLNSFEGEGATPPAPVNNKPKAEQPTPPEPAEGQAIHIREDLQPLLAVLKPAEVKKALGIAKAADVWVQDVMAHRLPAILRAGDPMGLLVHLIHSGEDWKRPAAQAKQQASAPAQESVASASTIAGWREDEERRRRDAEHQAAMDRAHLAAVARAARNAARNGCVMTEQDAKNASCAIVTHLQ